MPRARRSFGRAGTPVFPEHWQEDHGRVIESTFEATVTIGVRSAVAAWDPVAKTMRAGAVAPVYTGSASISALGLDGSSQTQVEDQDLSLRRYAVTLARGLVVDVEHVVRVTSSPDPQLTGETLTIEGLVRGSSLFVRRLTCTLG